MGYGRAFLVAIWLFCTVLHRERSARPHGSLDYSVIVRSVGVVAGGGIPCQPLVFDRPCWRECRRSLIVAAPSGASAGDLPPRPAIVTKAPPSIKNEWTWWVEGGAAHLSGDPDVAGLNNPPFGVASKPWGWEAAAGFDYQLDNLWHVSGQLRYGQNKAASKSNNPLALFNIVTTAPTAIFTPLAARGSNTAQHKESHWLADFMVGRELGLGQGLPSMARFGVRVAEIRGTTDGSAQWNNVALARRFVGSCVATTPNPTVCGTHKRDYTQQNSFIGAGPRIELDGSIPLAPRWSIDYMGGLAGLYGRRTAIQAVNVSQTVGSAPPNLVAPTCVAGYPINAGVTENAWVANADAIVGLSYAVTPNVKATLSYRFDGYWNALKAFDANGQATNLNRIYQAAMLRLTTTGDFYCKCSLCLAAASRHQERMDVVGGGQSGAPE
jgi:opacity protein-like surface antigen